MFRPNCGTNDLRSLIAPSFDCYAWGNLPLGPAYVGSSNSSTIASNWRSRPGQQCRALVPEINTGESRLKLHGANAQDSRRGGLGGPAGDLEYRPYQCRIRSCHG